MVVHFGGAIDLGEARYFNIVNCTFENNTATYGGAIGASSQSGSADVLIADSTFINNVASNQGGAYQATFLLIEVLVLLIMVEQLSFQMVI